ncbi:MAG: aspartyl protease family protein [Pseudomonadota bacterium]|nr:aspartyl protease family protein [Pseudomonadota bacterium]
MSRGTGKFGYAAAVIAMLAMPFCAAVTFAKCNLAKIVDLPVTMVDMHPMVTAKINGTDASFIADSGAFYSMLTPAAAAEFNLKTYAAPWGLVVDGIGGAAGGLSAATVKVFTLAGVPIHDVQFLVGGSEVGGGGAGVLGQNVFRIADVEYDLAKGVIRLIHEDGCKKTNLAYWANGTGEPYSVMDIEWTTPLSPHTTGTAEINGAKIRVMFDTGAATSVLSLRAAERAGVKIDTPGVNEAGYWRGIGRGMTKTWIAPFVSFRLGQEEVRNTRLRIGQSIIDSADMLIGADFFLSHRLYVASGQHRLYFTYNGGPVFNLNSPPAPPRASQATSAEPAPPSQPEGNPTIASNAAPPASSPNEPQDAAAYSRRGTAFAARRDFTHAIADLTRACELAPDEPNYFYERGIARLESPEPVAALADFDQAIKLKPDHIPALVVRAEIRLRRNDAAMAIEDLDSADRFASKEADARLRMAEAYLHADVLPQAVAQLDLWIAAHRDDSRLARALNERCWARGLAGQDLPKALDDCNLALRLTGKSNTARSRVLDGRGLVRLRLGDYEKSAADYDESLKLNAKNAWSFYGRGVGKFRRGKTIEGQADMAAATALWPPIADAFQRHGIAP